MIVVGTTPKANCPQSREKFQRHIACDKKRQLNKKDYSSVRNGSSLRSVEGFSPYGKYSSCTGSRKVLIWFYDLEE